MSGNTSGLLGYWDDSQESEYLRPNGTFLGTNSSLEEIHWNFGQLCKYSVLKILWNNFLTSFAKKARFCITIACTYTLFKNGFILKDEFIDWSRYLGSFVSTCRSASLRVNYHKDKRISKYHIILERRFFCGAKSNAMQTIQIWCKRCIKLRNVKYSRGKAAEN